MISRGKFRKGALAWVAADRAFRSLFNAATWSMKSTSFVGLKCVGYWMSSNLYFLSITCRNSLLTCRSVGGDWDSMIIPPVMKRQLTLTSPRGCSTRSSMCCRISGDSLGNRVNAVSAFFGGVDGGVRK